MQSSGEKIFECLCFDLLAGFLEFSTINKENNKNILETKYKPPSSERSSIKVPEAMKMSIAITVFAATHSLFVTKWAAKVNKSKFTWSFLWTGAFNKNGKFWGNWFLNGIFEALLDIPTCSGEIKSWNDLAAELRKVPGRRLTRSGIRKREELPWKKPRRKWRIVPICWRRGPRSSR